MFTTFDPYNIYWEFLVPFELDWDTPLGFKTLNLCKLNGFDEFYDMYKKCCHNNKGRAAKEVSLIFKCFEIFDSQFPDSTFSDQLNLVFDFDALKRKELEAIDYFFDNPKYFIQRYCNWTFKGIPKYNYTLKNGRFYQDETDIFEEFAFFLFKVSKITFIIENMKEEVWKKEKNDVFLHVDFSYSKTKNVLDENFRDVTIVALTKNINAIFKKGIDYNVIVNGKMVDACGILVPNNYCSAFFFVVLWVKPTVETKITLKGSDIKMFKDIKSHIMLNVFDHFENIFVTGNKKIVFAILCCLVTLKPMNGFRHTVHVLVRSENGMGKSTLANTLGDIFTKCVLVKGITTTIAGLMGCSIEGRMGSGAAQQSLAGSLIIDDFEYLNNGDLFSLNEPMEQMTFSYHKNKVHSLQETPIKVLAFGRKGIVIKPLNLPTYTRFDIIIDWDFDKLAVSKEVMKRGMIPPKNEDSIIFMKKYLAYCSHNDVLIPDDMYSLITNMYVSLRQSVYLPLHQEPKTGIRKLNSLIRVSSALAKLNLRKEVNSWDCNMALELIKLN